VSFAGDKDLVVKEKAGPKKESRIEKQI